MTLQFKQILKLRAPYWKCVRQFSTPVESPKQAPESESSKIHSARTHKVDNLERKMLVWTGKYKSADEVPNYVK